MEENIYEIKIKGLVQGIGFRPFIYKIAKKHKLKGYVENRNDCVFIMIEGNDDVTNKFTHEIKTKAPEASIIRSVEIKKSESINGHKFLKFNIIQSKSISENVTEICPDIAVCKDCLVDIKKQKNRINYAFTNCTNCGPRFTIINNLPYDREKTTMSEFEMCNNCSNEYSDIYNRRFHAQPIACSKCGPKYELIINKNTEKDINKIIEKTADIIEKGKLLSIKGVGGFHLACDAENDNAIENLRKFKNRDAKPFAVMFKDLNTLSAYFEISKKEKECLTSWRRPIVLLKNKTNSSKKLSYGVNAGLNTTGVFLPYMPFHYILFQHLKTPAIVLTSANLSNEPIIKKNKIAIKSLKSNTEAILTYNRKIYNRVDDSVIKIINNKLSIFRRSRGFVPSPIILNSNVDGIFAGGGELTSSFCIGKENKAILSQYIGDLKNFKNYKFYKYTFNKYKKIFRFKPTLLICDMHPNYLSTQFAEKIREESKGEIKLIKVQHHHAHIASCMAENNLDEKVIGISFDGTGYGDDGNIWGSEFFVCNLNKYHRKFHFEYIHLPGGDKSIYDISRTAISYVYKAFGDNYKNFDLDSFNNRNSELIIKALKSNINTTKSSGAGRLFDAVASISGICSYSNFIAEAPMRLESIVNENYVKRYEYEFKDNVISFDKMIKSIVEDTSKQVSKSKISTKFHNTIISVIIETVNKISKTELLNKVVLSGGTFQNKYISERVENILSKRGFEVFTHKLVPSNDGGIALGQMAIGAKRRVAGLL